MSPHRTPDAEVLFRLTSQTFDGKTKHVRSGYRPVYDIRSDYWTSTHHEFLDTEDVSTGQEARVHVWFITPEVYPHTLWPGRVLTVPRVRAPLVSQLLSECSIHYSKRMTIWDDYRRGLQTLCYALDQLQADSTGFRYPHHPDRLNVSPALLTALKNGIEVYAASHAEFAPFVSTVLSDYSSPDTNPETFQRPIYHELRQVIEDQLRDQSENT